MVEAWESDFFREFVDYVSRVQKMDAPSDIEQRNDA